MPAFSRPVTSTFIVLGSLVLLTNAASTQGDDAAKQIIAVTKEHLWTIVAGIFTLMILLGTFHIWQEKRYRREQNRLQCVSRVSVDEYERSKKAFTEKELQKLQDSKEYKDYLERKDKGEIKGIELDEDDKIELSDDSDNEESSSNQQAANGN